jgi:antitoxin PrlF
MLRTVSEKGQVTVPKRIRERLGIKPGDLLEFSEEDGRLIATKAGPADNVGAAFGILDLGTSTDGAIDALRGAPDSV